MNSSSLPNSRLIYTIRVVPKAASAIVILVSCLVLAGWILDIPTLKSVLPSWVTMKANTALAFIVSGVSLWLLGKKGAAQRRRRIGQVLALSVAIVGLLTLSQYLFNWNLGIDQLVFRELPGAVGTSHLGRMAPTTALSFILLGFALLLLGQRTRQGYCPFQFLTLTAALVCLQPLLGYVYGVEGFYGIASYTRMALHTVLMFIVLCVGILLARPDWGLMRIVMSDRISGFIARRFLFVAIVIPCVLGWLIIQGYRLGIYNTAFGLSILVMVSMVVFSVWIVQNAQTLDQIDTKRSSAQQALQESEERFRKFFEEAPIGISVVHLDGRFLQVNKTYCPMLGYLEEELHQLTFAAITHPEDVEKDLGYAEQLFKGEIPSYQIEKRYIKKNGEILWISLTGTAICDVEGKACYGLAMVEDITQRKQDQEALQETNQTLQALIQACPLAITVFSLDDGKVKMWNPAAQSIFGWSEREALGRFLPSVPQDKQDEFLANLDFVRQGNALTAVEARRQKRDGSPIDISVWAAPLRDAKGNISCMSIVADISDRKQAETALKQSEERFRKLAEKVRVIPWEADAITGKFTYIGPQTVEILGYPLSDWYTDNFWTEHIHPEDREWAINYCLECSAVLDNYEFEYRMLTADGRIVWLYDIVNVVRNEDGLSVLRGFMIDITQRKRWEEEREQLLIREQAARAASEVARSEAEEANRMKDEFLATLSHELRTPLNAMLGWTQMLRTRKLNEATTTRALETIERNTKSLTALIEDVLDVSGMIKGKLHLNIAPVELVPVIEAAIDTVRPAAMLKEIRIESIFDYSVEPILGDANRLQQVLWNLLSNAVKFTPQGGRVEVRLERGNNADDNVSNHVLISVSDTGKGIAPDFLPYVFDRFRQENSSTTRS